MKDLVVSHSVPFEHVQSNHGLGEGCVSVLEVVCQPQTFQYPGITSLATFKKYKENIKLVKLCHTIETPGNNDPL